MAQPFLRLGKRDLPIVRQRGAGPNFVRVRVELPDRSRKWLRLSRAELKLKKILKPPVKKAQK